MPAGWFSAGSFDDLPLAGSRFAPSQDGDRQSITCEHGHQVTVDGGIPEGWTVSADCKVLPLTGQHYVLFRMTESAAQAAG